MSQDPSQDPPHPARSAGGRAARVWNTVSRLWKKLDAAVVDKDLEDLRAKAATPVFWLFGKTQSGKTSIVRYLTGVTEAEIGNGFRPCTRHSRLFPFPTPEAPVMTFLDTRGVEEPKYDPTEDLAAFDKQAHVVLVTLRVSDFAHGRLRESLQSIRRANPRRPVLLVLTCLHDAYPQQQHPSEALGLDSPPQYAEAVRLIARQTQEFGELVDRVVPIDLTKPEEGYANPNFGGPELKAGLLELLPAAYRETLLQLDATTGELREHHTRRLIPTVIGYSSLAAAAGAIPVPFVDLVLIPGIQTKMIHALAQQSGRAENATRFLELSASMGVGLLARQAIREVSKLIPYVGSAVAGAVAYGSTYALGRAFLTYLQQVHEGHAPDAKLIKQLYQEQLARAAKEWKVQH
jgi:uncharacterized protein (DUF697 family)